MAQPLRPLGGSGSSAGSSSTCLTLRSSNKLQARPISKLADPGTIQDAQAIEASLKAHKSDLDEL